jgi:ELWxxDGT repeat protein
VTEVPSPAEPGGSNPHALSDVDGALYFTACDAAHGCEPWRSDGTASGTVRILDLSWGTGSSNPTHFAAVRGDVFFEIEWSDTPAWRQVWKLRGAQWPSRVPVIPGEWVAGRDALYVSATDAVGYGGYGLWRSDGTDAGTVRIAALGAQRLTVAEDRLFFLVDDGDLRLWCSDGTADGTRPVDEAHVARGAPLVTVERTLFFVGEDALGGRALWKTDGTPGGTALVMDLDPEAGSSLQLAVANRTLFFTANHAIWQTEASAGATAPLATGLFTDLIAVGGVLFFRSDEPWLWRSDGTVGGTYAIAPLPLPGAYGYGFTTAGAWLFFNGVEPDGQTRLWGSDGTRAGTVRLIDAPRSAAELRGVGDRLFFSAWEELSGRELWAVPVRDLPRDCGYGAAVAADGCVRPDGTPSTSTTSTSSTSTTSAPPDRLPTSTTSTSMTTSTSSTRTPPVPCHEKSPTSARCLLTAVKMPASCLGESGAEVIARRLRSARWNLLVVLEARDEWRVGRVRRARRLLQSSSNRLRRRGPRDLSRVCADALREWLRDVERASRLISG